MEPTASTDAPTPPPVRFEPVLEPVTEPHGAFGPLNDLLAQPLAVVDRARQGMNFAPFRLLAAGFAGTLGLLLAGLLPIAWLFSLSSRYLLAVTWIHIFLWALALLVGWRF